MEVTEITFVPGGIPNTNGIPHLHRMVCTGWIPTNEGYQLVMSVFPAVGSRHCSRAASRRGRAGVDPPGHLLFLVVVDGGCWSRTGAGRR
jgi:hypothetical protein